MRINRQILLKNAEDAVAARCREGRSILAVYMQGSMARDGEPLLGESGDVDLVFVHDYDPELPREFVRLTDEITLDISHHTRQVYRSPRDLRTHPWLGPAVYDFRIMHDPRHFLDFVQASLRDQYFQPGNVLARAQRLVQAARRQWMDLLSARAGEPAEALHYLEACASAANALISLDSEPAADRRLLTRFFEHARAIGQPELFTGLLGLLGAGEMDADDLRRWFVSWEACFLAAAGAPSAAETGLHLGRRRYYQAAIQAQMASERPVDALWLLLSTWTRAAGLLPAGHDARWAWNAAAHQARMIGDGLPDRLSALDAYLDRVEEILSAWGRAHGVEAY